MSVVYRAGDDAASHHATTRAAEHLHGLARALVEPVRARPAATADDDAAALTSRASFGSFTVTG